MAFLLLTGHPAGARAEEPAALSGDPVDEVVVITADRAEKKRLETARALSVIEGKDIEGRAARDVTDLVKDVPGVDVQSMGPAGYAANVSIRGSSDFKPGGFGNRVLTLLDGWPVNSPDTDGVDWASLPLLDLARIEILRGPASALYGSTALGGVVQLISRDAVSGGSASLGHGVAGGTHNRDRLAATGGLRFDEWDLQTAGWWQGYRGLVPPGQQEPRHNSDSQTGGGRVRAVGRIGLAHRWDTLVNASGSAGGNPGFENTSDRSRSRRYARASLLLGTRYQYKSPRGLQVESSAFWTRFRSRVMDPDGGNPNQYASDRLGGRGMISLASASWGLHTLGAELDLGQVEGDVYNLGLTSRMQRTCLTRSGAAFWQSDLVLPRGLEASAGLRLDLHRYSTHQSFQSLSPKLGLAYRPDGRGTFWIGANRGYRVPTIGELYLKYTSTYGLLFQGNPLLKPESLWAFELGGRRLWLAERLVLELVGFVNLGEDAIEFVYSMPIAPINLARSRTLGVELSAQGRLSRRLRAGASLSFLDARDVAHDTRLLYRPRWKGNLSLQATAWKFEWLLRLGWVGERLYDDFLDSAEAIQDPQTGVLLFPRRTLSAYPTLDVDWLWRLTARSTLALHATNLLDARMRMIQDYPSAGREFFLEFRLPIW